MEEAEHSFFSLKLLFELNREFPANTSSIKPGITQFNRDFILHLFINREKSASEKKSLRYRGGSVTAAPESRVSDKKGNGRGQKSCCLSTSGPVVKTNGALTSKKVSWTLDTLHVLNSHPLNSPLHLVCKHLERKGGEGVVLKSSAPPPSFLSPQGNQVPLENKTRNITENWSPHYSSASTNCSYFSERLGLRVVGAERSRPSTHRATAAAQTLRQRTKRNGEETGANTPASIKPRSTRRRESVVCVY